MTTRTITVEARRLIEEAASRGAHDDCMDALLFTLEESGYAILPAEPAGATGLREALEAALHDECSGLRDNTPCVGANWHEQARAALAATTPVGEGE